MNEEEFRYGANKACTGQAEQPHRTFSESAKPLKGQTPLADLQRRMEQQRQAIVEFGHKLRAHADAVYGESPTNNVRERGVSEVPPYGGAIGELFCLSIAVDDALAELAMQCGRNTTLA